MELASGRALRTWTEAHLGGPERHHVPRRDEKGIRASGQSSEEGQAALERARGETAALRSLANAGRAMDDNPNLVQLPAWQALADSSGNTLVFGMPNAAAALRQGENRPAPSGGEQEEE